MKICLDCSKPISRGGTRCSSCSGKRTVIGNFNFIEGARRQAKLRIGVPGYWTGKKHTDEYKRSMSIVKKGQKPYEMTDEIRESIRVAKIGGKHSEEHKRKISLANRGRWIGEKSNFWKGGVAKVNDLIRHSLEYKTWRNQVFKRDNFTCQICNTRGGELEADHLIPFSELLVSENIKTVEQAKKSITLWDLLNGRTLCIPCHINTSTYGNNKIVLYNKG